MCIRDSPQRVPAVVYAVERHVDASVHVDAIVRGVDRHARSVSYTHLRAHETVLDLVCRLLLEKKKETGTGYKYSARNRNVD